MNVRVTEIKNAADIYHPSSKNVWRISAVLIGGVQHYHAYSRIDGSPFLTEPVTPEQLCKHLNEYGFMLAASK